MSQNRPLLDIIRGTVKMSEDGGGTNVSLFCCDLPYDAHNLSSLEGTYDVYSDEDSEMGTWTRLEWSCTTMNQ